MEWDVRIQQRFQIVGSGTTHSNTRAHVHIFTGKLSLQARQKNWTKKAIKQGDICLLVFIFWLVFQNSFRTLPTASLFLRHHNRKKKYSSPVPNADCFKEIPTTTWGTRVVTSHLNLIMWWDIRTWAKFQIVNIGVLHSPILTFLI